MNKEKLTMAMFRKAVKNSGGLYAVIAKRAGTCRQTVSTYIKNHKEAQELIHTEKETILDISESSLFKQAQAGEQWAVKYLLSTQAKNRGYIIAQNIDHTTQGEKIGFTQSEQALIAEKAKEEENLTDNLSNDD